MTIALVFIVLSAWCAEGKDFDIPCHWIRSLNPSVDSIQLNTACVPNLQSITIYRSQNAVESVHFSRSPRDLELDLSMQSQSCDLKRGNFFEVSVGCLRCYRTNVGFVTSVPQNSKNRRFMVVGPDEQSDTHLVKYENNMKHAFNDLCEYRAEKTLFTVTRFLCKYQDLSYFFVSAQVAYDCPRHVVIEWGIKERDGSLRANNEKCRQEFNFPLCACA